MRFLFPSGHCPRCRGPITFFDVLGIVTPFQCIYCPSCSDMVFLRNPLLVFFISILTGGMVFYMALMAILRGVMTDLPAYLVVFAGLMFAEYLATFWIVKKNLLVVRRQS